MFYEATKRLHSGCISARCLFFSRSNSFGFIFWILCKSLFSAVYTEEEETEEKKDRTVFGVNVDVTPNRPAHAIIMYGTLSLRDAICGFILFFCFFFLLQKTNFATHTDTPTDWIITFEHLHFCWLAISWSKVIHNLFLSWIFFAVMKNQASFCFSSIVRSMMQLKCKHHNEKWINCNLNFLLSPNQTQNKHTTLKRKQSESSAWKYSPLNLCAIFSPSFSLPLYRLIFRFRASFVCTLVFFCDAVVLKAICHTLMTANLRRVIVFHCIFRFNLFDSIEIVLFTEFRTNFK